MSATDARLLYKTRTAAEKLDVSERYLEKEIQDGRLLTISIGPRGKRIEHAELLLWIEKRKAESQR